MWTESEFLEQLGYDENDLSYSCEGPNHSIIVRSFEFNRAYIIKKPRAGWCPAMLDWLSKVQNV